MEGLPQGYRPNVGVCLINSDDQIFVASRLNVPGAWQMPQVSLGGIEEGEEPKSAAIRELREETGIVSAEIIAEVQKWLTYDFPPAVKAKVNRLWGGEWHGQAQKWFLMRLTKDDSEVNLANGEAEPEFAEWKWADPEEVIEQAVDYKRPTYEEVIRTFKPYFQGSAISGKCKSTKWSDAGRDGSDNTAMCICGKQIATVVVSQGTFLNRRMRCCNFLPWKMCYRLKHKFAEKKFVRGVGSGSKLRNKVVALIEYNLSDLIGNGSGEMSPKNALDDVDMSLICKRFPSITLGSAPRVDLYDGTTSCFETMNTLATENFENCFSDSSEARWVQSASEEWPSLYVKHSTVASSTLGKDNSFPSSLLPDLMPSIQANKSDQITREDCQMKVGMESQPNPTLSELFLDKSINCIPGLSKRHYQKLENCGFHTLRKLLLHFPRSYADMQNGHAKIDDGQYLIFVGKVLASRGVKANYSFSFLEVVVGCQIAESECGFEHVTNDAIDVQEKTIYLHLKKFFRGSRFTFKGFLQSLAEKYQEGDIVCVSGKVRTMRAKDHYEMREYNIDVLEDGKDLSFFAKERPYPIYPSKGV
ncbi:hypothetical protein ACSQ67_005678 [Phaseolus vulgaris]